MRPAVERLVETLPAIFAVGTIAVVALLAVSGFGTLVPAAAVLGWLLLTPLSAFLVYVLGVTGDSESDPADSISQTVRDDITEGRSASGTEKPGDEDPLDTLRNRYARGEIDEVEFERSVERLLETEDVAVPPGATLEPDDRPSEATAETRTERATDTEREPARER